MSRTLDFSKKRSVNVIDPNGKELEILPVRMTIAYHKEFRKKLDDLNKQMEAKKLDDSDQIIEILKLLVSNYKEEDFKVFSISELTEIMIALREITENPTRTEEEKKIL